MKILIIYLISINILSKQTRANIEDVQIAKPKHLFPSLPNTTICYTTVGMTVSNIFKSKLFLNVNKKVASQTLIHSITIYIYQKIQRK